MIPIINYHYIIPYKEVESFEFIKYNEIVNEECYKKRILPKLPKIIDTLINTPQSRQAVIVCNNEVNNACLISLQFQIENKKLIVIANFRYQCEVNGRPYDTEMLQYIGTLVSRGCSTNKYKIYVNVGNYHLRTDI